MRFRRRRIPRRTYTKQIGFTEEPPLFLQRKRAGLPRYEDRLLVMLVERESGAIEWHVLFDPDEAQKESEAELSNLTTEQIAANERAADQAIAKHEAIHPGCNERYWYERATKAEAAAAHFFHCRSCANDSELCPEGKAFAVALGLVVL